MTMDNIACVKRVPAEWAQMELSPQHPFVELSLEERHQAAVGVYQDGPVKATVSSRMKCQCQLDGLHVASGTAIH